MMREDRIEMSVKEIQRAHVIRQRVEGHLKQREAAKKLEISVRQVRRLEEKLERAGEKGLIHGLRGKDSGRRIPEKTRMKVLGIYRKDYHDFGPTFACEKLLERNGINLSDETLRQWLIAEDLWKVTKRKRYRRWRERRSCLGEMVQMDGSHHAWLEERGPKMVLMGYIDDATSRKSGQFYEYEGTLPAMESLKRYIRRYGIPLSVYLDRHSTYKGQGKPTLAQELKNEVNLSQFERACKELGIQVIHAHSAPAKGRIERSFKTDQDRLVKEMRLSGIQTLEEANRFLPGYWSRHNKRFAVTASKPQDVHRSIPKGMDLDAVLSIRTERLVRNDFTIQHEGKWYQILEKAVGNKVVLEEHTNGQRYLKYQGRKLAFKRINPTPVMLTEVQKIGRRYSQAFIPAPDHPWRKPFLNLDTKLTQAA
jgi:transposase